MKDNILLVLGIALFIGLAIAKITYMTDMCERHGGTFNNGMCLGSTSTYQKVSN